MLDPTTFPAWREQIAAHQPRDLGPRRYVGYPTWDLPRGAIRRSLGKALAARRSSSTLGQALPTARQLGRLLLAAHGITGDAGRGPVPSAGGLQALELYLVVLEDGWLPAGAYHYDRTAHALAQVRDTWPDVVPSRAMCDGGALLWILVGDGARVAARYGERAAHFLALEAGHLMQNLCLCSEALGLVTVPLGGYYERAIAEHLRLLADDLVLYVGICG